MMEARDHPLLPGCTIDSIHVYSCILSMVGISMGWTHFRGEFVLWDFSGCMARIQGGHISGVQVHCLYQCTIIMTVICCTLGEIKK